MGLPSMHIRLTIRGAFLRRMQGWRHTLCGAFLRGVYTLMHTPTFYDKYRYSIALCLPLGFAPSAREVRATRAALLGCIRRGGHFWGRKRVRQTYRSSRAHARVDVARSYGLTEGRS
jgi:hypothetical protein